MNCDKHGDQPTICRFCDADVIEKEKRKTHLLMKGYWACNFCSFQNAHNEKFCGNCKRSRSFGI